MTKEFSERRAIADQAREMRERANAIVVVCPGIVSTTGPCPDCAHQAHELRANADRLEQRGMPVAA